VTLDQDDLTAALGLFWHPVCTVPELAATGRAVLGVQLLGRRLAVADLGGAYACVADRCLHRSTRLSVGWVDDGALRCAYHGWRWAGDGRCVEIPAAPDTPIPSRACIAAFEIERRYDLLWVRLDNRARTEIPACPAWEDPTMKVVAGQPYTWPTSAPRRVENFVDLAHFSWVHDGSLGRRDQPVPPVPDVRRERGELRFEYVSADLADPDEAALVGPGDYRVPMPCTVDIAFEVAGMPGVRRHLWMTASPLDSGVSRSFWLIARNDRWDEADSVHLAFQDRILAEDEPVVCNQDPPEIPLEPGIELSVRTDKVSIEYRRWLVELVEAARKDPGLVEDVLGR
jgi:phenylpropionate dioxygenase-like ring-hydroxylating dioxygenase large terminal subunit